MTKIHRIVRTEDITEALRSDRAIVFKHSTQCPVSASAKRQVETFAEASGDSVAIYLVDVIADRGLSNEIAARTGIEHHSPQVIFIRNNQIAGSVTHRGITQESLSQGIGRS